MKKVIVAAANGFLGRNLVEYLKGRYEVVALVRKEYSFEGVKSVVWDGETLGEWVNELEGAFAVVNLAGRSVDCRYNDKNKAEIYRSRLNSTAVLGQAIDLCDQKPKVWLNAASATIYRHSLDTPMTEEQGEYGTGFSVDVCQKWEETFFEYTYKHVRQVALRTAIVIGKNGGSLAPMKRLAQVGLGGKQGRGDQMFSWLHIEDFCAAVEHIMENEELKGPVNMSAPNPVQNHQFMRSIRNFLNQKMGIPLNKTLLELGARIIKTETELILKSRYVIPRKLLNNGYSFRYPTVEEALNDLFKN